MIPSRKEYKPLVINLGDGRTEPLTAEVVRYIAAATLEVLPPGASITLYELCFEIAYHCNVEVKDVNALFAANSINVKGSAVRIVRWPWRLKLDRRLMKRSRLNYQ